MTTLFVTTVDGPPDYRGRHRRRQIFTAQRAVVSLLITFWLTAGTVGAIAAHGMWSV